MSAAAHPGGTRPGAGETGPGWIPRPRVPLGESIRRMLPRPAEPDEIDLDVAFADLHRVAVRTSAHGSWQENACFLLGSSRGRWQVVPFSHPATSELLGRLRALPGFEEHRLLEVIGSRESEIVILWRDPYLLPAAG